MARRKTYKTEMRQLADWYFAEQCKRLGPIDPGFMTPHDEPVRTWELPAGWGVIGERRLTGFELYERAAEMMGFPSFVEDEAHSTATLEQKRDAAELKLGEPFFDKPQAVSFDAVKAWAAWAKEAK